MLNFLWRVAVMSAVSLGLANLLAAGQPINQKKGLALRGYDAVAYFTEGRAVKGDSRFRHEWMGAVWRFSSAENRDRFSAAPEEYAPQFGGYCAYAVSEGYLYDANPKFWKIVDGKLYLNYNRGAQRRWEADIPGRISKAQAHWPSLIQ